MYRHPFFVPQFGPVAPCQRCGADIQVVRRYGDAVVEDSRTGLRHSCPPGAPGRYVACSRCDQPVVLYADQRVTALDGRAHICRKRAPSVLPTARVPRPGPAAQPRVPRGTAVV